MNNPYHYKSIEYSRYRLRWKRRLLQRYKTIKGCNRCKAKLHFSQLQFDHINKETKWTKKRHYPAILPTWGMKRMKQELAHCQVLCANCHAYKTWKENIDVQN